MDKIVISHPLYRPGMEALEGKEGILSAVRFADGQSLEVSRLFVALGTAGSGDLAPSLSPRRGLGLGLELVRRGVRLHGGVLLAEPRPEGGLRWVISLPIRRPEGGGLLRTPRSDYSGGFSPLLVELSDVLPMEVFLPEELQ